MRKRIFAALSIIFLFQAGCAKLPSGPEAGVETAVVQKLVKSTQSWDGTILPGYPQGQPEITILRITIPPGTKLAIHRHPVINAGVLIRGQLTVVTTAGRKLQLNAGDPIVEVVDTLHYGVNQGKDPAEIIVFYAGSIDKPITVTE